MTRVGWRGDHCEQWVTPIIVSRANNCLAWENYCLFRKSRKRFVDLNNATQYNGTPTPRHLRAKLQLPLNYSLELLWVLSYKSWPLTPDLGWWWLSKWLWRCLSLEIILWSFINNLQLKVSVGGSSWTLIEVNLASQQCWTVSDDVSQLWYGPWSQVTTTQVRTPVSIISVYNIIKVQWSKHQGQHHTKIGYEWIEGMCSSFSSLRIKWKFEGTYIKNSWNFYKDKTKAI